MPRLGGLRRADPRSLDGSGEADKLGEGIAAFVGYPEVAAGVDGEGVGLEELGVGSQTG